MPRIAFTKRTIERLSYDPATGTVDYFDTATKGLGLRVGKGSKTFFVKAEVRDPSKPKGYRSVRKVLGRFGEMSLEQARKEFFGYDDQEEGFVPGARLVIRRGKTKPNGSDVPLGQMLEAYFQEKRTAEGRDYKQSTVKGTPASSAVTSKHGSRSPLRRRPSWHRMWLSTSTGNRS